VKAAIDISEHFQEKWNPVFRPKMRPCKILFGRALRPVSGNGRRTTMAYRGWIATMTLAAGLCMLMAPARAFD